MASTYVNDLRLNEMATGDASGTWGEVTNTNLELIAEAFSYGTEAITTNANTHTTTIADGATDPGRSMYLKYTGTLDSACTITIGPNTVSKLWFIENATSGSQNIIISQGSGANITIPPGDVKVVYSDGAGSGAAVVDAFASLSVVDLKVQDDLTVTDDLIVNGDIDLEGNMDVNGSLETDALSLNGTTVTSTAAEINLLDGSSANTVVNSKAVIYGSSGQVAGTLSTAAQTNITSVGALNGGSITSGFGSIDVGSSAITTTGTVTGNTLAGTLSTAAQTNITSLGTLTTLTVDDITINGSTISDAGDLDFDVGGDIILNADGGDIRFRDGSTEVGTIVMDDGSNTFILKSTQSDADIKFNGVDGGSGITALTLDMSDAGTAIFNHDLKLGDGGIAIFGASSDLQIYHDGTNSSIQNSTGDLFIYGGTDDIRIRAKNDEESIVATPNGAVTVYYDGSPKIATTSSGIDVTGTVTSDGLITSGNLVIGTEDNNAAIIEISGGASGSDEGGEIRLDMAADHDGTYEFYRLDVNQDDFRIGRTGNTDLTIDSSGNTTFGGSVNIPQKLIHSGDTDTYLEFNTNQLDLIIGNVATFKSSASEVIINEASGDVDFRVESNNNANMLFVDGGNDRVGIGVAPTSVFEVQDANSVSIKFGDLASYPNNVTPCFIGTGTSALGGVNGDLVLVPRTSDAGKILFATGNGGAATEKMRIGLSEMVINEGSADYDFRVESNGVQYMLFVDGGNDKIGINQNSPQETLDVDGNVRIGSTGRWTTATNVFKSLNTGENGASIRSAVSTAANPTYSNVDDTDTGMFLPGSNVVGFTAGSVEKLRISDFLVEPESGVNIGSIRNNGVTVGTSATNVLDLGSVNSSGDLGKGRYLVTACATSGTVGTAGSAIYGLSTSGAVYLYETVNGNSVTFGSNGSQVTLSVASGSYSMHVNAIPLSVDN